MQKKLIMALAALSSVSVTFAQGDSINIGEAAFTFTEAQLGEDDDMSQNVTIVHSNTNVYASEVGYLFSPTRFRYRAFNQKYNSVFINGAPQNDMESGQFRFSTVGGLNRFTRNVDYSMPFESNSFAMPDMAGSNDYDFRAGSDILRISPFFSPVAETAPAGYKDHGSRGPGLCDRDCIMSCTACHFTEAYAGIFCGGIDEIHDMTVAGDARFSFFFPDVKFHGGDAAGDLTDDVDHPVCNCNVHVACLNAAPDPAGDNIFCAREALDRTEGQDECRIDLTAAAVGLGDQAGHCDHGVVPVLHHGGAGMVALADGIDHIADDGYDSLYCPDGDVFVIQEVALLDMSFQIAFYI